MPLTPTDIARVALHQLTELGLPPTPDNFNKYYHQISGEPDLRLQTEQVNFAALLIMIRDMLCEATERTALLAKDIHSQNRTIKSSLDDLGQEQERKRMLQLLGTILTTATSIHSTVEDAHLDLVATKMTLEHMKAELQENRQMINEDWLTGAQNRRSMDMLLAKEVARAHRNSIALTVAMLDIDHFKDVNDTFGHDAGDQLLQHLTLISKAVLRESDSLVRYGGEEFLIVLPETDINGAEFVLGRLRQAIQKSPLVYESKPVPVTFSAGLARLKKDENGHALVMRADAALYQAKQAGRDCIRIAAE